MSRRDSPLRYPGGKACLTDQVIEILKLNNLIQKEYAEPFAGGCGLALGLLYKGYVSKIHLNDYDEAIWSFWYSVLNETDRFISKIKDTQVTLTEWQKQKSILNSTDKTQPLELGFATFFLNRTNRSGIIEKAGLIGGYSQNGKYKIDCRFNKKDLIKRIRKISSYKSQISIYNHDALELFKVLKHKSDRSLFYYIDPPYYDHGINLYTNYYKDKDHEDLSLSISKLKNPWLVTYDDVDSIKSLYQSSRQFKYQISYSLQRKRKGTELFIVSDDLKLPIQIQSNQINSKSGNKLDKISF